LIDLSTKAGPDDTPARIWIKAMKIRRIVPNGKTPNRASMTNPSVAIKKRNTKTKR